MAWVAIFWILTSFAKKFLIEFDAQITNEYSMTEAIIEENS